MYIVKGLPPTPTEVAVFVAGDNAKAYEDAVDRMLASRHFGERLAMYWLDLVRYADTVGYHGDQTHAISPYRDYVIDSFHRNKPFDVFTREQLAGDLFENPTLEQKIATGYNRLLQTSHEGGVQEKEYLSIYMADRIRNFSSVWMGATVGCAQCHDHRYDPIPQTDYYAVRAVFEPALDWQAWKDPNGRRVSLFTKADREKSAELEAQTKPIAAERATKLAEYMQQALEKELTKYEEPLRTQLKTAYETPGNKRTAEQKSLLTKNPSINISPGNLYQYIAESKPKLAEYDKKIADIRAKKPVEES